MPKRKYDKNNTSFKIMNNVKSIHPVVEKIADNLSEIDEIRFIRIKPDLLQASSETATGRVKTPITKPDHPTAIGVSLILDLDYKQIQFYEMNSVKKGFGTKMVDAIMNALQDEWKAIVVMDWSGGFWDRMAERYKQILVM